MDRHRRILHKPVIHNNCVCSPSNGASIRFSTPANALMRSVLDPDAPKWRAFRAIRIVESPTVHDLCARSSFICAAAMQKVWWAGNVAYRCVFRSRKNWSCSGSNQILRGISSLGEERRLRRKKMWPANVSFAPPTWVQCMRAASSQSITAPVTFNAL